jgi:hypothetical protein
VAFSGMAFTTVAFTALAHTALALGVIDNSYDETAYEGGARHTTTDSSC